MLNRMVITVAVLTQRTSSLRAVRFLSMSVHNVCTKCTHASSSLRRPRIPELIPTRTHGKSNSIALMSSSASAGGRIYSPPQSVLTSVYCPSRSRKQTGLASSVCLPGRHLSSDSQDGADEIEDEMTEAIEVTDRQDFQEAKSRATQQFQNMHQMLEDAQVQAPTKDFDFADVPQSVRKQQQLRGSHRPRLDPREMSIFLFPGQGSQYVGMGRGLLKYPHAKEMFMVASEILGYDLLDLCLNGSQEELNKTRHSQPAVLVCSLAAVEKLREEQPKAVENCVSAAGFSVGEISALVFSGALSFEDAVQLIKVRAKTMQEASDQAPSGMLTVIGRPGAQFKLMCREAMDACILNGVKEPVCTIASHLFPEAKVVAGHTKALDYIQKMSRHYTLRLAARVAVSGAFHSPLMASATQPFYAAIDSAPMEEPAIAIHANVNGKRYRSPKHIRSLLKRHLLEPIHWEQTMHEMYQRGKGEAFPKTFEVGPGNQLGGFLRRNNLKAYHSYSKVEV